MYKISISSEIELPVTKRKNDIITAEDSKIASEENLITRKLEKLNGQDEADLIDNSDDESNDKSDDSKKKERDGGEMKSKKNKRGDRKEREERDDTRNPKTKDADWTVKKINEANNQQGGDLKSLDETNKDTDE